MDLNSSRTEKSAKNVLTGVVSKILIFIFAFLSRTVFVKLLGAEYTGINGLYTNILSVLAMADLGINNVFSYTLYQALADKDEKKIATLINSFKRIYNIIGLTVIGIGILIIPFMKFIIKTSVPNNEVILYYVLYLVNTASSYFFCYKTIILSADQKQYYDNILTTIAHLVMYGVQTLYLLIFKDYIGYLLIQLFFTILKNYLLSRISSKNYPFIDNHNLVDKNVIQFKDIFTNIKSTFIYKMCSVLLNNTDNILISVIVSTIYVGYYSNYYLLIQYINAYIYIFSTGLLASIGNVNTENNAKKSFTLFNTLLLVYAFIGSVITCVFFCCVQSFIPIWLGKEYLLSDSTVIAIIILMYTTTLANPVWMYRETMGLFNQVKYVLIPTVILNVIFSIIFGKIWGVSGIIFATTFSKFLTTYWYEPIILYKKFDVAVRHYYITQIKYIIITSISLFVSYYICKSVPENIIGLFIKALISGFISLSFMILINYKTDALNDVRSRIFKLIKRKSNMSS